MDPLASWLDLSASAGRMNNFLDCLEGSWEMWFLRVLLLPRNTRLFSPFFSSTNLLNNHFAETIPEKVCKKTIAVFDPDLKT